MNKELQARSDISKLYKWNTLALFESNNAWKEKINEVLELCNSIKSNIQMYNLKDLINNSYNISRLSERIFAYVKIKKDENNFDEEINKMYKYYLEIIPRISETLYYINMKVNGGISASIDTKEVAKINAGITGGFNQSFNSFLSNSMEFEDVFDSKMIRYNLNPTLYNKYIHSSDRVLRKNSFISLHSAYAHKADEIAKKLYCTMKNNVIMDRKYGYKNSLESTFEIEGINRSIYDNLIISVDKHLEDVERYNKVKKKKTNIKDYSLYDLFAPINVNQQHIDFEDAKQIIYDSLRVLGNEYIDILNKIFDECWIDVFYNKCKVPISYSFDIYDLHPYILLNYQGKIADVFILAHEIGHAIHYYLSDKTQSYENSRVKTLATEIAALTNEILVYEYLLKKSGFEQEVLALYIDKFRSVCFKQALLAEFEEISYEKILSGEILNSFEYTEIYEKLLKKYYKGIKLDLEGNYGWARVPHFYKKFLVYKYAIAFCVAINISHKILEDGNMKKKYINYLKLGSLYSSYELIKDVGIDIAKNEYLEYALNYFTNLIDRFEK